MIGKKIFELDSIDSTNAYANRLLMQAPLDDGDVIWAHEQFAGRGQHNHTWVSEADMNLTFTVILRPCFVAPDRQFLLNKIVSLAVVDFLRDSLVNDPASIKWPNDIYIGNLKIGGILIENKIMGSILETSIAGIGVNINQTHFTQDIPNPASMIQFLHRETSLKDALLMICRCLDRRYNTLKEIGPASLDLDFDQHLLGIGQWRKFICHADQLEGKIKGVNNLGQLLIETRMGQVMCFNHHEVEYVL